VRVLVLGSGAREHSVAWMFSKSNRISGLFIAPGNAGTEELGVNITDIDINDSAQVIEVCRKNDINIVFIGPEKPLDSGVADDLLKAEIPVIGPPKESAKLETSKTFSKNFMQKHKIPTAKAEEFSDYAAFEKYIKEGSGKQVLKKNGLAGGKGVLESDDTKELLDFGKKVLKDDTLLVEDFLEGYEVSVFAFTDGEHYLLFPTCADFKKAEEGDTGPNTGGMGAICPVPWVDKKMMERIKQEVVEPTFNGIKKDGLQYHGVLYFGLMITNDGPKVLEYNVRLGDPETQALFPIIESDFGNLIDNVWKGKLDEFPLEINQQSSMCVVIASKGYPGVYEKEKTVSPIPIYPETDSLVFHAATERDKDDRVITTGGRCFSAVGLGKDLLTASIRAYEAAERIQFNGSWYRKDIGRKFFME